MATTFQIMCEFSLFRTYIKQFKDCHASIACNYRREIKRTLRVIFSFVVTERTFIVKKKKIHKRLGME